jgi:hypothetical protein
MGTSNSVGPLSEGEWNYNIIIWRCECRPGGTPTKLLIFVLLKLMQCVSGTFIDAYFQGYDCVMVEDITATTSPAGGLENVLYNAANVSVWLYIRDGFGINRIEGSLKVSLPIRPISSMRVADLFYRPLC